jgi:acyl-CoA synthetase (AMP-forming)/AMP-acid ligase II
MLYDSWLRTARACSDQLALLDVAGARRWTFGELLSAVENGKKVAEPIVFPQGDSAEFIICVLKSWHRGAVVCPVEPGHPRPQMLHPLPSDIVHLKTTSATTGKSRLVAFTARQLMADAENIVQTMGLRSDWPNLGVISLAHSYGFSNLVLPLLFYGIPLILVGSALPEALRSTASAEAAVTLAAVPALWQTWHHADAIPRNVRLAISAGAPLPLALEQAVFAKHGLKIHNFYGSSECGGIAFDSSSVPRTEAGCAGMPLRNVRVTAAEDGCVEVRSDAVAETYWPEGGPDLGQGVFHTSDVGHVCGGLVHLCGRAGDQINVAGRKVLPETIEAVLASHPQVRSCVAFGVPSTDTQRGETIVACVAAKTEVLSEGLRQFALANLPAWQVPREWWFVDSLEANSRGKLSRAEWRKRYLESARGPSPLRVNSPRSTR